MVGEPKQMKMVGVAAEASVSHEAEEAAVEVVSAEVKVEADLVETIAPVAKAVIDDLSQSFAKLRIKVPVAKECLYPIETDLVNRSLEELRELHTNLMRWMKGEGSKYPRLLVPYYKYRIRLEGLLINKK
jgi:hypothetical protein